MAKLNLTLPVGRIVQGSIYDPETTDMQGVVLVVKNGANAGQPRVDFWFRVAIPKAGEQHWSQTAWGQQIWNLGNQLHPGQANVPGRFSWKIEDGDDTTPNPDRKGRKNNETEGWAGSWVVKLSGGFAPKVYQQEAGGYVQVMLKDFVKPGYYVETAITADSNKSASRPGMYLNHSMVCFRAYGPEINFGPDVASAGFGQSALPAGASATPLASVAPMPQGQVAAPVPPVAGYAPPVAGYAPPPLVPVGFVPTQPVVAPIAVVPNHQFLAPAPTLAPPPAAKQMTALAQGAYEAYVAAGWTDAQLVQNGLMVA